MKAVGLSAFGDSANFVDVDAPAPSLRAADVLIRTKAVGFNPIDYQVRSGGFDNLVAPVVLGFEVSGVVEAIGPGVSQFAVGDRVMAWLGGPSLAGGYAELAVAPEDLVVAMPSALTFSQGAAVPLGALTAFRSLRRARAGGGKSLFIAGGAGGVGSWAILLSAALGIAHVVTTAGSDQSAQYIMAHLGIPQDSIVRYRGLPRDALAAEATRMNGGALFDIALDCVGDAMTRLCGDAVTFDGVVVSIVNGPRANPIAGGIADEDVLFNKSAEFHFELLFAQTEYAPSRSTANYARDLQQIARLIESGTLRLPRITEVGVLSAETVRQAHRVLESGHTTGKLVATVS